MAFRLINQWHRVVSGIREYATSTLPKMKAYSPTANFAEQKSSKKSWGYAFVCSCWVYNSSSGAGTHTVKQQLLYNPHVFVKVPRETLPEVVEPDRVVEAAHKFVSKSFFRKVAHVQELDFPITSDPILGDVYAHKPRAVTLKDAGVDPKEVAEALDPRYRARLRDPKKVIEKDTKAAAAA